VSFIGREALLKNKELAASPVDHEAWSAYSFAAPPGDVRPEGDARPRSPMTTRPSARSPSGWLKCIAGKVVDTSPPFGGHRAASGDGKGGSSDVG
jgi:hypothetical protein